MGLPKDKDHKARKDKALKKLQRSTVEENKAIRNDLRQALIHAAEHDNGNAEATEDMRACLADARDNGLAKSAITIGGGMVGKIAKLLDKPPAHSHAVGLLLNASALLAQIDPTLAADIKAKAEAVAGADSAEIALWREISTPSRDTTGT